MTTLYDLDEIERKNAHIEGELKDAKRILREYLAEHSSKLGRECHCDECNRARAWLARNKQA